MVEGRAGVCDGQLVYDEQLLCDGQLVFECVTSEVVCHRWTVTEVVAGPE